MSSKTVPTTHKFRAAIRAGRFDDASDLLVAMRSEVEAEWRAAGSPAQRERIAKETTKLLEWARAAILASRAHVQSKLAGLKRESAYTPARQPRRSRLDLEV